MNSDPSARQEGVAAVERAFAALGARADRDDPGALAGIARATGYYRGTILRLAASREASGCMTRLPDGRWLPGGSAHRPSLAYERQNPLREHVVPIFRDMAGQGPQSASCHARHGKARLCLFRMNSHRSTPDRVEAGAIPPRDRGAAGRTLHTDARDFSARSVALSRGKRFTEEAVARIETLLLGATARLTQALGGEAERMGKLSG